MCTADRRARAHRAECNDLPCDTGSSRAALEADPQFAGFDFSLLSPDWTSKKDFYGALLSASEHGANRAAADDASLRNRARWIRQYLRERPEQNLVVMGHGDILRRIAGEPAYPWTNAEVRVFQFVSDQVHTDECPLEAVERIAVGGWAPEGQVARGGAMPDPRTGSAVPVAGAGAGAGAAAAAKPNGASGGLEDMEERVKRMYVTRTTRHALTRQPGDGQHADERAGRPGPPPCRGRA